MGGDFAGQHARLRSGHGDLAVHKLLQAAVLLIQHQQHLAHFNQVIAQGALVVHLYGDGS